MIRTKLKFPTVSFHRFYLGIFLGILTSITFYLLFFVCREAFRFVFSITDNFDIWILTARETWFYNLVFAFISSIFGEGVCLKTWYERPKQFFNPYFNYRRKTIINDIFVLNTNFLNVFTKLAVVYVIWFGESNSYIDFNINSKYNYIWFLVIIVLHFEQWKAIRLIFKDSSLKGMTIFTIAIILLSFFLSFINPKVFERVNNKYLSKSIDYNYKIERPISYYSKFDFRYYSSLNLYFVYPKNIKNEGIAPTLLIDHKVIDIEDLCFYIAQERDIFPEFSRDEMTVNLHIDKNTKMKYIKKVKEDLAKCGIEKISYASVPPKYIYPLKFCRSYGVEDNLSDYDFYSTPEEYEISYLIKSPYIKIDIIETNFIEINETTVQVKDLAKALIQKINTNKFKQLQLYVNDDVDYQTYINIRDIINRSIVIWRDKKVYSIYGKEYSQLDIDHKIKFDLDYYFEYFELSDKVNNIIKAE